ncbi:hypothetical protein [Burkholderia sp. LMU1-1-1.1]|uniref:hypothetical protein n=1 Tax=Burkholderia sp. LMU1-1-1.1 TaxID=3135266 RepID=UPI003428A93A
MNSTTFNTHTNANYAGNVANAVRQLFAALFARKPVAVTSEATAEPVEVASWWMSSAAKDLEARSPILAVELRYIAARFG